MAEDLTQCPECEAPAGYVSGERFSAEHERLRECRAERDAALSQAACLRELLTRCQEHLDPHRDAALWSDVCAALGPKP